MNNSSMAPEEIVQEINDGVALLFTPAIVYICMNMITGLLGNSMVVYYYGCKAKRTPTSVFILALAAYDLIVCTVTMPHEIIVSLQFYTYDARNACKAVEFVSYFAIMSSVFTLPVIAVDRYRHICVDILHRVTVKDAIKHCAIVATLALLFALPTPIIYGIQVVPLPIQYGQDLQGTSCTRIHSTRTYGSVFDSVLLITFGIIITVLVVLYVKISRVLYIHRKEIDSATENQHSGTSGIRIDRITVKITIGMIVIATVFFLGFIPRLSVLMWSSVKGEREDMFLSGAGLLGFQIGRLSYMLNSSLNPWIYGIFNSQFRQFYYRALCKRSRGMTFTI